MTDTDTDTDTNTLVQAFIASRLDYCNALFYGITDELIRRLQLVQNAAARLVTGRLYGTIVGPTGWSDWSVRLVGPTIASCKRFVRPIGQTVGRIKHV